MTFPDLPCQLPHIRSQLAVEKSVFSLPDNCEIKKGRFSEAQIVAILQQQASGQ
jgi:hypothetical protein